MCGLTYQTSWGSPEDVALTEVVSFFEGHGVKTIPFATSDLRANRIDVEFQGKLRPTQEEAIARVLRHDDGVICAPTAFPVKTAVAAWVIATRKVNTLVMVHRQQLLDQWRERLAMFYLERRSMRSAKLAAARRNGLKPLMSQSFKVFIVSKEVKDYVAEYGHVIVDECHHLSAFSHSSE